VPLDGLVWVRLQLMQAIICIHQLLSASSYAPDRKDGCTPQALEKILAQHPLARDSTTTMHGRFHVHCLLARGSTTPTRPRRVVAILTRPPMQPQEGHVGAHTCGRPPRPHDQPAERRARAPIDELQTLSKHSSALLGSALSTARWLPAI
jgi:hypothetical protein